MILGFVFELSVGFPGSIYPSIYLSFLVSSPLQYPIVAQLVHQVVCSELNKKKIVLCLFIFFILRFISFCFSSILPYDTGNCRSSGKFFVFVFILYFGFLIIILPFFRYRDR